MLAFSWPLALIQLGRLCISQVFSSVLVHRNLLILASSQGFSQLPHTSGPLCSQYSLPGCSFPSVHRSTMCSHKCNSLNRSLSESGFNRATSWRLHPPPCPHCSGSGRPYLSTGAFTSPNPCLPFRFPTHFSFPWVSHSPSSIKNPLTLGPPPADGSTRDRELLPHPALPFARCLQLNTTPYYGEDGLTSRSLKSRCFKQKDQPPRPCQGNSTISLLRGNLSYRVKDQGKRIWRPGIQCASGQLQHPAWPSRHLDISLLLPFLQWILMTAEQLACSTHSASAPASKETCL